jgi:hypothetical protein
MSTRATRHKEDVREIYRVYWFERLHGPPVGDPVAYHFLAQGHGKTQSGAVQIRRKLSALSSLLITYANAMQLPVTR